MKSKTYYLQSHAYMIHTSEVTACDIAAVRSHAVDFAIEHGVLYVDIFDEAGRHMSRIRSSNNKRGYILVYVPPEEKETLTVGMQEYLAWERSN